ncbi:MAG: TlpA disulfide reductase family protein [bacterium]
MIPLALAQCASPEYRNYSLPEALAPEPPAAAGAPSARLDDTNSESLPGGIRLVHADRARLAPSFRFSDARGGVHTNDSLEGRVVWVDLWATWCATCIAELPRVRELQGRQQARGLVVLGVCRDSPHSEFTRIAGKAWVEGIALIDASAYRDFPFPYAAFPTSVLLDRAGRVRAYWRGHRDLAAVEAALERLLEEPGGGEPLGSSAPEVIVLPEPEPLPTSADVVTAELVTEERSLDADGYYRARVRLEISEGWHVAAAGEPGLVGMDVRFVDSPAIRTFDRLLPRPAEREIAGIRQSVYDGHVEMQIFGFLEAAGPPGERVPLRVVASVQACDDTKCLLPAEIPLEVEFVRPRPERESDGGLR